MSFLHAHWQRFARYLFSGLLATSLDIGLYLLFISFGVYFVTASIVSGVLAFFAAFFLHKHVTYQAKGQSTDHFVRYCILTLLNFLAQNIILYIAVTQLSIPESWSKVMANGSAMLWNFFLYRKFVYRSQKSSESR